MRMRMPSLIVDSRLHNNTISPTLITMPPKKRKIENDRRAFNEEWIHKYFFTSSKNDAVCLQCQETIAVL